MADELSRKRKLTEAVSNNVLGDEYFYMILAVVDPEGESHHLGGNLARPRPRLNNAGFCRLLALDFLQHSGVNIWAFGG